METGKRRRVALLLGENEISNAKVMGGILEHCRQHMLNWNLLLPLLARDGNAAVALAPHADAFIASSDEHDLATLAASGAKVIGIALGSAQLRPLLHAPLRPALVVADNAALALSAYDYLITRDSCHLALFGAPLDGTRPWVLEREQAFVALARRDRANVAVLRCDRPGAACFDPSMATVLGWLARLPKPVAIFAADAMLARTLSQACAVGGYEAGSEVLIVGVDCDPLAQDLSPVPMASVMLDRHELGRRAALMLQRVLEGGVQPGDESVAPLALVQPARLASPATHHPLVMRALHYIRLNARRGIKAEQVAYYVDTSRSALETRFKRALGRSVHDEILRFKIDEAKQMLRSGAASMQDVAVDCGFTSVQYLYTVFGRELGCTPRVWQDRMLKQGVLTQAA